MKTASDITALPVLCVLLRRATKAPFSLLTDFPTPCDYKRRRYGGEGIGAGGGGDKKERKIFSQADVQALLSEGRASRDEVDLQLV